MLRLKRFWVLGFCEGYMLHFSVLLSRLRAVKYDRSRFVKLSRHFEVLLYPDSTSYDFSYVLSRAVTYFDDYAYIQHDKDGVKAHVHFYGYYKNKTSVARIAKFLGLRKIYINPVAKKDRYLAYLCHIGKPDKYQYPLSDVVSNFNFVSAVSKFRISDSELLKLAFDYQGKGFGYKYFLQYCLENGLYPLFKANNTVLFNIFYR